jgi:hypothetical protein
MKVITDLLTNKWFWIGAIGLIIVIVVIPKLFKKKLTQPTKWSEEGKDQESSTTAVDTDLQRLAKKGIVPSYTKTELASKAEVLHTAMDGCLTDYPAILRVFASLRNEADVYALIDVYGIRKISCWARLGTSIGDGTLSQHLAVEADEPTKKALNDASRYKGWGFRI